MYSHVHSHSVCSGVLLFKAISICNTIMCNISIRDVWESTEEKNQALTSTRECERLWHCRANESAEKGGKIRLSRLRELDRACRQQQWEAWKTSCRVATGQLMEGQAKSGEWQSKLATEIEEQRKGRLSDSQAKNGECQLKLKTSPRPIIAIAMVSTCSCVFTVKSGLKAPIDTSYEYRNLRRVCNTTFWL